MPSSSEKSVTLNLCAKVTLCVRHVDDVSPRNRLVDEELESPAMAKADDEYYTAAGQKKRLEKSLNKSSNVCVTYEYV
jgi:hypothetical protein